MIKRITRFGPTALSALVIALFATVAALFVGTFTNRLRARTFLAAAAIAAGLFSAKVVTKAVAQTVAQNVAAPYSITYEVSNSVSPNVEVHTEEQRRNGDRVEYYEISPGVFKRFITFTSAGLFAFTNTVNKNVSTLGKGIQKALTPDTHCDTIRTEKEKVGQDTLFGYQATHYRAVGAETIQDDWAAGPELGCAPLKRVTSFLDDNGAPTGQTNTTIATKITAGDPPDSDFAYPVDAIEVSPSAFEKSINSDKDRLDAGRLDAIYNANKSF